MTVYEIVGLINVNGDGVLELAARYCGYEWFGVQLFDLRASPKVVLGSSCGV